MKNTFIERELRRLDLNLLVVFAVIMRTRSIREAAANLRIGSPAVSMSLRRLRSALDDPLFVRAQGTMEPTDLALALWVDLEPALASIERGVGRLRSLDPSTVERDVRISLPDDLDTVILGHLVDRLSEEAPGIRLIARPSDYRTLLDRLDSGDADMALSALAPGMERRHRARKLHQEGYSVLYDRTRLNRAGPLDLVTWLQTPQIMRSITGDTTSTLDHALAEHDSRRVAVAISSFSQAPLLLKRRAWLINMPENAARILAAEHDLEVCPLPVAVSPFDVALHWHVRTDSDPLHRWLRTVVAETVTSVVAL